MFLFGICFKRNMLTDMTYLNICQKWRSVVCLFDFDVKRMTWILNILLNLKSCHLKHLGLKSDRHCAGLWQPEKGNTGRTSGRHCWLPSYTLPALFSKDIGQVWSFKCAIVQLLDVSNGSFFKIFIIVATWLVLSFCLFIFSSFRLFVFSSFCLFVCSSFRLLVFLSFRLLVFSSFRLFVFSYFRLFVFSSFRLFVFLRQTKRQTWLTVI